MSFSHKKKSDAGSANTAVTLLDPVDLWAAPDNLENPRNWSSRRKWFHIGAMGLAVLMTTFNTAVMSLSVHSIMAEFDISHEAATLVVTLSVFGIAWGPAIASPVSELYGRIVVLRLGVATGLLFTIGAAASPNFASLLVCRFMAGICTGPLLPIWGAVVADLASSPRESVVYIAYLTMIAILGTPIGPMLGGYLTQHHGWRWTQWVVVVMQGCVQTLLCTFGETYEEILTEKQRAAQNAGATARRSKQADKHSIGQTLRRVLLRPMEMLMFEPIVTFMGIYTGFYFGVLYGFAEAFSFAFGRIYQFDLAGSGFTYTGIAVGAIVGGLGCVLLEVVRPQESIQQNSSGPDTTVEPRDTLRFATWTSPGLPISLFWFAWSATTDVHWIVPCIAGVPLGITLTCFCVSMVLYLLKLYGSRRGASALAAGGIARYTIACVFPLFTEQIYEILGVPWATTVFAVVGLLLSLGPFVLFRYGHKLCGIGRYGSRNDSITSMESAA